MSTKIPVVEVNQYEFLEHRRQQERNHWNRLDNSQEKPLDSILTIEINTTELCNRTCVFCPRHDPSVYPNRNLHLTVKGAMLIAEELMRSEYTGKISFSGFGENLLNPWFVEIVEQMRYFLPSKVIE